MAGPSIYSFRLRRARRIAGLSTGNIAKRLGISRTVYKAFERRGDLPISHVAAFCTVTGCSPQYLLTGEPFLVALPSRADQLTH